MLKLLTVQMPFLASLCHIPPQAVAGIWTRQNRPHGCMKEQQAEMAAGSVFIFFARSNPVRRDILVR